MAGGSDWPVTDLVPFDQMEMAVTRTTIGTVPGTKYGRPLNRALGLRLRESVITHTYGGAFQAHLDGRIGSLEVGKDADLLVLDRNVFDGPARRIHEARPVLTMVRGRVLHRAAAFDG